MVNTLAKWTSLNVYTPDTTHTTCLSSTISVPHFICRGCTCYKSVLSTLHAPMLLCSDVVLPGWLVYPIYLVHTHCCSVVYVPTQIFVTYGCLSIGGDKCGIVGLHRDVLHTQTPLLSSCLRYTKYTKLALYQLTLLTPNIHSMPHCWHMATIGGL